MKASLKWFVFAMAAGVAGAKEHAIRGNRQLLFGISFTKPEFDDEHKLQFANLYCNTNSTQDKECKAKMALFADEICGGLWNYECMSLANVCLPSTDDQPASCQNYAQLPFTDLVSAEHMPYYDNRFAEVRCKGGIFDEDCKRWKVIYANEYCSKELKYLDPSSGTDGYLEYFACMYRIGSPCQVHHHCDEEDDCDDEEDQQNRQLWFGGGSTKSEEFDDAHKLQFANLYCHTNSSHLDEECEAKMALFAEEICDGVWNWHCMGKASVCLPITEEQQSCHNYSGLAYKENSSTEDMPYFDSHFAEARCKDGNFDDNCERWRVNYAKEHCAGHLRHMHGNQVTFPVEGYFEYFACMYRIGTPCQEYCKELGC